MSKHSYWYYQTKKEKQTQKFYVVMGTLCIVASFFLN